MTDISSPIQTADLDWQSVDGVDIPISRQFGDVYFSKDNGLLETRHVFLNGNDLSERLPQLGQHEYFTVGETGFGTGLNFLTLWQLWQQVRPNNHSHLHFISVEKFPLSLADLTRALNVWDELKPLATQLIAQYPLLLAGCHRLSFPQERISIDLWLGDAAQCFPLISSEQPVNAWFLDGFAPSCNPEMWQEQIFKHIIRLSAQGTTFASFSVAGVLKRALRAYCVHITRPKGFGHKREMLKAVWLDNAPTRTQLRVPDHIAVIGAGIAGLNCAWQLAQRGLNVTIFEKEQPLAGGSGNPLAMLNPKLCPIEQVAHHLMTVSWQYALRYYRQFSAFRPVQIYQLYEKLVEQAKSINDHYPDSILSWHDRSEHQLASSLLHHAGTLSPHQFAEQVLSHPLIQLQYAEICDIQRKDDTYQLIDTAQNCYIASHVIACNALALNSLCAHTSKLKAIRGQVSWATLNQTVDNDTRDTGYSYGGYAIPLDSNQLIFGASFLPHQTNTNIELADHEHNLKLLQHALPQLAKQLPEITTWQGRASLRAQTADYFPLAGRINLDDQNLYCLAGLGSKGFLFAPLCSEIIISQILGQALPIPHTLLNVLRPTRFRKKT